MWGDTMITSLLTAALVASTGVGVTAPVVHVDHATRAFMSCVSHRESRGIPTAVSSSGKHRGKYQVTPDMARGMSWNILPWLRSWNAHPVAYAATLRRTPMNRWPERVQDAAFIYTLHYQGKRWSEWRHWYLPGSRCNQIVPAGAR